MEDNFPLPEAHSSHPMQQRCHQPLTMEMMPGFTTPCDFPSWWGRMKRATVLTSSQSSSTWLREQSPEDAPLHGLRAERQPCPLLS